MIIKIIKAKNNHGKCCICKCDWCGKIFKRYHYIVNKMKNHYCNRECMARYFEKFYIGEKNPNYGKENKFKGSNSPHWKGGIKHLRGRIYISSKDHPHHDKQGYVSRARLVMEKYLGRYLKSNEIVHHINGCVVDDRIENLELNTNEEHSKYHTQLRWDKNIFVRDCKMLRNKKGQFTGNAKGL